MARKTAARGRRSEHAVAEIPLSLDDGGRCAYNVDLAILEGDAPLR